MIVVRLQGGLGNQMFQYAFGLATSIRLQTELYIDIGLLEVVTGDKNQVLRGYELDLFDFSTPMANPGLIRKFNLIGNESFLQNIFYRVLYKVIPPGNIIQKGNDFSSEYLHVQDNHCLIGRWQSEKYFHDYAEQLKKAFAFKSISPELQSSFSQCKDDNLCAVHIRRGDYVTNPYYAERLGALDLGYYHLAMDKMKARNKDIRFLLFSNDYGWCKQQHWNHPVAYACNVFPFSDAASEFYLMSRMPNHIISNSTFSWWAAWLAEGKDSLIAGPESWAKTKEFTPDNILPERWEKIRNSFV